MPIDMPTQVPPRVLSALERASARHDVPMRILVGVAWVESRFNPNEGPSSAGAVGLMQLMPDTAEGLHVNPYDPVQAADGAARFLASLKRRFGSWESALAAYNWGPTRVERTPSASDWPGQVRGYVSNVLAAGGTLYPPRWGYALALAGVVVCGLGVYLLRGRVV